MGRFDLARRLGISERIAESSARAVAIEEADPIRFMAAFARAVASDGPVFLADPGWGASERAVLADLMFKPAITDRGWLLIPSGGTSGRLKFARHDEETLSAAVRGFCMHFQVERVNCIGVLPLHHVSGLMAWMRSALTGGMYLPWEWKQLEAGNLPPGPSPSGRKGEGWFLSLVPTQLQRLLASSTSDALEWLCRFDAVFIGGGPLWPDLAASAAKARLPLSPGYGMTETAAMVAALRPEEFLAGCRSSGSPMPHARIELTEEAVVRVTGESVFRGYFPEWREQQSFTTEDLGILDEHGHLQILGRRDAVIITGGKKVDPEEVEASLRASGEFTDVAVVGVPDPEWGQAMVACYPETQPPPNLERVQDSLKNLAPFKHPRRFQAIKTWHRNAQGKLNRAKLGDQIRTEART